MPAPENGDQFLDLVRKSGVVDEARLRIHVDQRSQQGALPTDLGKLAGALVRDGILTHLQAEQFLQGKWRRFTIGKSQVLERLGTGGQGTVYLCARARPGRPPQLVAIKVLPAARAENSAEVKRFHLEARRLAALMNHPNFVQAFDLNQEDLLHFLIMEFVDGSTFQDIVGKNELWDTYAAAIRNSAAKPRPMDVFRAAHYIRQAAEGLQHLHAVGQMVHGDIEPSNLMLDRKGQIKIIDLGQVPAEWSYTAPEQIRDPGAVDIRADIYSLGAVFYFLLAGRDPYDEGARRQQFRRRQTHSPRPIREIRPEVPAGLAAVLEQMMAEDREDRHLTPAEVVEDLAPWTETPIAPPPEEEMPRYCPVVRALLESQPPS